MTNKYYQKHKGRLQKEAHKTIKISLKMKKTKDEKMFITKSLWGTKAEATWVYEKIVFNT